MAVLSIPQAGGYASAAYFSGQSEIIIVAIAIAESGLDTHAVNSSDPYGGSFGILQINGAHFGDKFGDHGQYTMSESAAFDPGLSFIFAWELSKSGQDFTPWGTYTSGKYNRYVPMVRAALGGGSSGGGDPFPPYSGEAWYNYAISSDYPALPYHNTDVATPTDTPLTAPLAGTITDLGYFDWGGQVTVKVDQPSANNGYRDYFLIHLDALNPYLKVGQHIDPGTFLGYSGGQLSNAGLPPLPAGLQHHVTLASHSSGPHLDIGVTNVDYGSLVDQSRGWQAGKQASDALVLGSRSGHIPSGTADYLGQGGGIGPDYSPSNNSGQFPIQSGPSLGQAIHNTLVQYPGFYGIADALDEACTFPGFVNEIPDGAGITDFGQIAYGAIQSVADFVVGTTIPLIVRGMLILVGIFLLLALLWQLAKPNMDALADLVKLGALAA